MSCPLQPGSVWYHGSRPTWSGKRWSVQSDQFCPDGDCKSETCGRHAGVHGRRRAGHIYFSLGHLLASNPYTKRPQVVARKPGADAGNADWAADADEVADAANVADAVTAVDVVDVVERDFQMLGRTWPRGLSTVEPIEDKVAG